MVMKVRQDWTRGETEMKLAGRGQKTHDVVRVKGGGLSGDGSSLAWFGLAWCYWLSGV